jgi:hypothetical protein
MDKLCLPTDVWTIVHQKLCRDDVCTAAQVWPGSIDDPILNTFTPGGIPVCVDCAQKCGLQAYDLCTTKMGKFIFEDTSETIKVYFEVYVGMENDEYNCLCAYMEWLMIDVMTITIRQALQRLDCKRVEMDDCFMCLNKTIMEDVMQSTEWKQSMRDYFDMAAADLSDVFPEPPQRFNEGWELEPYCCQRCGLMDCSRDKLCVWFFGEDKVLAQRHEDNLKIVKSNMARACKEKCRCSGSAKSAKKKDCHCSCTGCRSLAAVKCKSKSCRQCCRQEDCTVHWGEDWIKANLPRVKPVEFVTFICKNC